MAEPFQDAVALCKTIMRNGFDAYVVNANLQSEFFDPEKIEIDIASDADYSELKKLFPNIAEGEADGVEAVLREADVTYRFYPSDTEDASHPEECVAKVTPRLLRRLGEKGDIPLGLACPYLPRTADAQDGFADFSEGEVKFLGIPDQTLKENYLRAVRALRFSANYGLPIEANSWIAILRGARRVLDYVSITDIIDEWRKVEAENMHAFVRLMYDSMIMHGLIPEIAAMARISHIKVEGEEETVFDHTLAVMERYPEELPFDWYGVLACLFHDVGKLHTAENFGGQWTFYQHHRVGAKVTRKILKRLGFAPEDVDLVCHLVQNHMRLHFMLTERGIRRFAALDEYPRLIEMTRADLKARAGSFREFNHNMKMLERLDTGVAMGDPILNGTVIMQLTGLNPGPGVGIIREALLKAQIQGDVTSEEEAMEFVKEYYKKEKLG